MNGVFSVIFIVIWIMIAAGSFSKVLKGKSGEFKPKNVPQKQPSFSIPHVPQTIKGVAKRKKSTISENNLFMEDRKNDWFARQIREEQNVFSKHDMMDLGAVHERACQADMLRRLHLKEHDNSIDTAEK